MSDIGHKNELEAETAMPIFVFAASLLLRVGNEGPLPPMREGYAYGIRWADNVVEAVFPAHGPVASGSGKPAGAGRARQPSTTVGVLVKTVTRSSRAVTNAAVASPGAAARLISVTASRSLKQLRGCRAPRSSPAPFKPAPPTSPREAAVVPVPLLGLCRPHAAADSGQDALPATHVTGTVEARGFGAGVGGSWREGQKPVEAAREVDAREMMELVSGAEGALADGDLDAALLMAQQVWRC